METHVWRSRKGSAYATATQRPSSASQFGTNQIASLSPPHSSSLTDDPDLERTPRVQSSQTFFHANIRNSITSDSPTQGNHLLRCQHSDGLSGILAVPSYPNSHAQHP